MKMADVVQDNYLLMPVISRFGIPLGFGEKTVQAVCRKYRIDVDFFLAITNAFTNENYFPEKKLHTFNVLMILDYLQKTHSYYIETQVPLIEKLLNNLLRQRPSDAKKLKLIKRFFLEYKHELFNHLDREETTTFPYVKTVYRLFHTPPIGSGKACALQYSMHVYEEEHTDVDEKLYDLKNILIKYVHGDSLNAVYQEVIFELFRLEKDIQDHTRIENNILLPLVEEMEEHYFIRQNIPDVLQARMPFAGMGTKSSAPSEMQQLNRQRKSIRSPAECRNWRGSPRENWRCFSWLPAASSINKSPINFPSVSIQLFPIEKISHISCK